MVYNLFSNFIHKFLCFFFSFFFQKSIIFTLLLYEQRILKTQNFRARADLYFLNATIFKIAVNKFWFSLFFYIHTFTSKCAFLFTFFNKYNIYSMQCSSAKCGACGRIYQGCRAQTSLSFLITYILNFHINILFFVYQLIQILQKFTSQKSDTAKLIRVRLKITLNSLLNFFINYFFLETNSNFTNTLIFIFYYLTF